MPRAEKILESTFNVDLLALAWIFVAVTVLTILGWYFYDGLGQGRNALSTENWIPPSRRSQGLVLFMAAWWALDLIWHSRAIVVTPHFWQALVKTTPRVPVLSALVIHLWAENPIAWDFGLLVVNALLVLIMAVTWPRIPRYLVLFAMVWGILRWVLTGLTGTVIDGYALPGPGGDLLAASAAYLLLYPRQVRVLLAILFSGMALDIMISAPHTPGLAVSLGLVIGFSALAWGIIRGWPALTLRTLLIMMTIDAVAYHLGTSAYHSGLNTLVEPALLVLGWSIHMNTESGRRQTHLGG